MDTQYTLWIEGHATPIQAATELAVQLKDIQFHQEMLNERERIVRSQLSEVVARHGSPITAMGLKLELTAASKTLTYDRKSLDDLVFRLMQDGYGPIAEQIGQCRRESERAGSLRVTKEKAAK